jgi:hypothetical protein
MDPLTFVVELVKALAWPVTALIILFVLRRPIEKLLPLVQRVKYGGIELDFGLQVQELAVKLSRELPASLEAGEASRRTREHLNRLSEYSPRAVVLEGWLLLEEAAIEASKSRDLKLSSRELRSPILLGHALERAGIFDEDMLEIFHRLRNLRNAAAHASEYSFSPESAREYAALAIRLADFIRSA